MGVYYYNVSLTSIDLELRLWALFAGACLIYLSLARRDHKTFLAVFLLYFISTLFMGFSTTWKDAPTLRVAKELAVWGLFNAWDLGLFFFLRSLYPAVPGGLLIAATQLPFFFLVPALRPLERWVSGFSLLLIALELLQCISATTELPPFRREPICLKWGGIEFQIYVGTGGRAKGPKDT